MRETGNPYAAAYGSPLQKQKIASLFPEGAGKFDRVGQLESDMGKTHFETLGGASTAGRLQADAQLSGGGLDIPAAAMVDATTSGHPVATSWAIAVSYTHLTLPTNREV